LEVTEKVGSVEDLVSFQELVFVFVFVFDFGFDLTLKDGLDGSCHFLDEEDMLIPE
jgi:hypothetical protein